MSQLPIVGTPGDAWDVKDYTLEHNGRLYHFGSKADRWCFEQDPVRHQEHQSLIDRFLSGQIQPADLPGALAYMGLGPGEMGQDAHNYAWAAAFKKQAKVA